MSSKNARYYDGKIYGGLIDPRLQGVREIIESNIKKNSKVLDLGCGTGALVFMLANKSQLVTGIELSPSMIRYAQQEQQLRGIHNVDFLYGDASYLPNLNNKEYDYAVISMALHEMRQHLRLKVLREAERVARTVIIVDYDSPLPISFRGITARMAEFAAGFHHYKMFRDFQRNQGIEGLIGEADFLIKTETLDEKGIIKVVVAQPR